MDRIRTLTQAAADDPSDERIRARLEWLMARPETVTDELVAIRRAAYSTPGFAASMRHIMCLQDLETRKRNLITDGELAAVPHGPPWSCGRRTIRRDRRPPGWPWPRRSPGAEFEHVSDAGHWPQWEQRDIFNRLVLGFLGSAA
jgi:2-hydroxy-6-oxonona-2,4-dienedioate hydrolase